MTREYVEGRYQLVKAHDRVGRMADSWEYSDVPFPKDRLDPALVEELRETAPSLLEDEGDRLVLRHLYIERRMVPLNIFLEEADEDERDRALREYGQAIKEMVAANIFPGDMLYKNFGVTRQGRVVFYDYDEVVYLTDCNFRKVPQPRTPEDETGVRAVVSGRAARRVPGGIRHLPAGQRRRFAARSCATTPTC